MSQGAWQFGDPSLGDRGPPQVGEESGDVAGQQVGLLGAAKWPPRGKTVQRRMSYGRSYQDRDGTSGSRARGKKLR
jgi:hypothetical protein